MELKIQNFVCSHFHLKESKLGSSTLLDPSVFHPSLLLLVGGSQGVMERIPSCRGLRRTLRFLLLPHWFLDPSLILWVLLNASAMLLCYDSWLTKRGPSLVWSFLQKKSLTSAENLGTVEALLILIHGGVYYKVVPVETCCNVEQDQRCGACLVISRGPGHPQQLHPASTAPQGYTKSIAPLALLADKPHGQIFIKITCILSRLCTENKQKSI